MSDLMGQGGEDGCIFGHGYDSSLKYSMAGETPGHGGSIGHYTKGFSCLKKQD